MEVRELAEKIFMTIPEKSLRDILRYIDAPSQEEANDKFKNLIIDDLAEWIKKEKII